MNWHVGICREINQVSGGYWQWKERLIKNGVRVIECCMQNNCDPVQQKVHLVDPVYSEIINSMYNIKTIKGNSHFVKLVFSKVSLQFFINLVSLENLLNLL